MAEWSRHWWLVSIAKAAGMVVLVVSVAWVAYKFFKWVGRLTR